MRDELAAFAFIAFLIFFSATEVSSPGEDDQPRIEIPATQADAPSKPMVMLASWYGEPFHGRLTASGKVFDMFELSAACLDLPLGKWIRAKNPRNGKSVEMEITDLGPYIEGRDLDVSMKAALELGFAYDGLAFLIVEIIDPPKPQKNSPI